MRVRHFGMMGSCFVGLNGGPSGCPVRRGYYIIVLFSGHALGFYHEQSRPDRDDYVIINWNNIQQGWY